MLWPVANCDEAELVSSKLNGLITKVTLQNAFVKFKILLNFAIWVYDVDTLEECVSTSIVCNKLC